MLRKFLEWLPVAIGAIFVAFLASWSPSPEVETSVVKIQMEQGHGSGVYIGKGLFLTANHVLSDDAPKVILSNGKTHEATVLWRSPDYDIALVKAKDAVETDRAFISCKAPTVGQPLVFRGNPLSLTNQTAWGYISGSIIEGAGSWRVVYPVNGSMVPGMSGGPAFDEYGYIVGINVGTMIMRSGMGGTMTGFGFIVPSSTICELLAK